jgi:hypothetical protein
LNSLSAPPMRVPPDQSGIDSRAVSSARSKSWPSSDFVRRVSRVAKTNA